MVQVPGFQHKNSTQLFFCLWIRTIGDGNLAVLPSQGGRVPMALQRFTSGEMTVPPKHIVVREALVYQSILFAFGYRFPCFLIQVS